MGNEWLPGRCEARKWRTDVTDRARALHAAMLALARVERSAPAAADGFPGTSGDRLEEFGDGWLDTPVGWQVCPALVPSLSARGVVTCS